MNYIDSKLNKNSSLGFGEVIIYIIAFFSGSFLINIVFFGGDRVFSLEYGSYNGSGLYIIVAGFILGLSLPLVSLLISIRRRRTVFIILSLLLLTPLWFFIISFIQLTLFYLAGGPKF